MPLTEARNLLQELPTENASAALTEVEDELLAEMLEDFPQAKLVPLLNRMYAEEAADVLGEIPETDRARLLRKMGPKAAAAAQAEEKGAGGGDVDPKLYGGNSAVASLVNRQRDDFEIALIKVAMEKKLPILGVCRGCQILNVAHGGTLRNLMDEEQLADQHFNLSGHPIELADPSQLAKILKTNHMAQVKSFHFQAVQKLGQTLRITATGPGGVVEAIEGTGDSWILAVQWHPELEVGDPQQEKILKAFINEAKSRKR